MRLIYVTPFCPWPPWAGATIRSWQTLRFLAQRHEVNVIVQELPVSEDSLEMLGTICASIAFVPPQVSAPKRKRGARQELIRDALRYPPSYITKYRSQEVVRRIGSFCAHKVDWLICETQLSGQLALSPDTPPVRKAIALYDIYGDYQARKIESTHWGLYRAKFMLDRWKVDRYESAMLRAFDLVVTVSERDRQTVHRLTPGVPSVVVPNGVDAHYFSSAERQPRGRKCEDSRTSRSPTLLFVGSLSYEPNQDAVRYFISEILPIIRRRRPETRFIAAGNRPAEWLCQIARADSGVEVTGPLDDVRTAYHKADVVVVPLRLGSGTKLKVLEALAMEVPTVTTPEGMAGLEVCPGQHLLLGTTPEEFAEQTMKVVDDSTLARSLTREGRSLVKERYDWASVLCRFEKALEGKEELNELSLP